MRMRLSVGAMAIVVVCGCSGSTEPSAVVGRYSLLGFDISEQQMLARKADGLPTSFIIDSVADTLTLGANHTYQETGYRASHLISSSGEDDSVIAEHGTYTFDDTVITVTDQNGVVATGLFVNAQLTLNYKYDSWIFKKE